jgi:hypothetical protein
VLPEKSRYPTAGGNKCSFIIAKRCIGIVLEEKTINILVIETIGKFPRNTIVHGESKATDSVWRAVAMGKDKLFMDHPGERRFMLVRERAAVSITPLVWTPGCLIWLAWLLYLLPPISKNVCFCSGVACDFLNGSVWETAWCLNLVHVLGIVDMATGDNPAKT